MSSGFPQRANLNESITKTILSRAGNNTLMSEELQRNVNIICNDCEKKSEGKFHIVAIKCKHCNSYNTNLI